MNSYQTFIGVVIEKLDQTYKDLNMTRNGLASALQGQTEATIRSTPELITISDLLAAYDELIAGMEKRFPGLKPEGSGEV
jgi:hypothetical protein